MKHSFLTSSRAFLALLPAPLLLCTAPIGAQIVGGDVGSYKTKYGASGLDLFGSSVCGPGDLNGDGVPDYVIGARGAWTGGEIYAYSGADHSELWMMRGEGSTDDFGSALASVADLDGDGVNDVAVSAPNFDNGAHPFAGKVYVLSGASGGEIWSYPSVYDFQFFGTALAAAGDVNGDGYEDVVAGMPYADSPTLASAGRIVVLSGKTGTYMEEVYGTRSGNYFGRSVAGVGDLNADGYGDVVVGVPGYDPAGMTNAGRITILSGKALAGLGGGLYIATLNGDADGGELGSSVCRTGDLNRDGTNDFLAGAPLADTLYGTDAGMAYLYSGDSRTRLQQYWGKNDGDHFGLTVAPAGDVNHDGLPDLLIGAPFSDSGFGLDSGVIYAYDGDSAHLIYEWEGEWYAGKYGSALAGLGDLNRDGTSEIIATAPEANESSTDDGAVQIVSLEPDLTISQLKASIAGATVDLDVDFGWYYAGEEYQVLVSVTGDGPTTLDGVSVPLTADARFTAALAGHYPGFCADFMGNLDGYGQATAVMSYGHLPVAYAGKTVYFAAVRRSGGVVEASSIMQPLQFVL